MLVRRWRFSARGRRAVLRPWWACGRSNGRECGRGLRAVRCVARGRVGDISGLNPWLEPSAGSWAQMVLWAPPCQLKLGLLLSWGRVVKLSSWGGRVRCRWSRARAGMAGCRLRMTAFGGRASVVGEAGEVCGRASGAAAGPKVQPADVLGLAHSHVDQAQGAELLCACAGVARRSTAAGAVAAAGGRSEPIWLPCGRVWTA